MNFYWVYHLPNWVFGFLVVGLSVTIGLSGMLVLRIRIRGLHGRHSHNEIVSVFFASMAVFYGVAVGLFSVGAWQTYTDVESKVALEAATLASLYRDVSHFAEPERSEAQAQLGTYTRNIIDQVWPQQRKGIVSYSNDALLSSFYDTMVNYEPSTEMQKEVSAESLRQFNRLIELRRLRLQNVTVGLPRTMLRCSESRDAFLADGSACDFAGDDHSLARGHGQSVPRRLLRQSQTIPNGLRRFDGSSALTSGLPFVLHLTT